MGVIRREGDWRLEKRDDGMYEISYQERPELKIITSDHSQQGITHERTDFTIPVREVESFSDAEALFQEAAQGGPPGVGGVASQPSDNVDPTTLEIGDGDGFPDLPPVGALLVGAILGGYLIVESGLSIRSPMFLIGGAFLILPLGVLALTYQVYTTEGAGAAVTYLFTVQSEDETDSTRDDDDETEKTPPAPENLKNELYFERAERQCEWCGEDVDSPDTHHIKPREEGGPNERENLIVLCPNCHRKADRGMISRSKLRHRVSDQVEN
jgi:hypothetical protein